MQREGRRFESVQLHLKNYVGATMHLFRFLFAASTLTVAVGVAMVGLHVVGLHMDLILLGLLSTLALIFIAQYVVMKSAGLRRQANSTETALRRTGEMEKPSHES